jgi:hypothetical protein
MSYLAIMLCLHVLTFITLGVFWHAGTRIPLQGSENEKLIELGIEARTQQLKYREEREKDFQEKWNDFIYNQSKGGSGER